MKPRLISVFLFIVMMIIVGHTVVPHHHHEEFVMHDHDVYPEHSGTHAGKDHHPVKCFIQAIDFSVPRALTHVRCESPSVEFDSFISALSLLLFSDTLAVSSFSEIPPSAAPMHGVIRAIPPRAPPC